MIYTSSDGYVYYYNEKRKEYCFFAFQEKIEFKWRSQYEDKFTQNVNN